MKQKLRRFMAGFLAILTMFTTLFTNGTTAFAASSSANIAFWVASSKDHGVISEFNSKHTGSILYAMIDGHSAYCMNFGLSAKGGQLMNSDSNPNTNLSAAQEKLLAYCMYYGIPTVTESSYGAGWWQGMWMPVSFRQHHLKVLYPCLRTKAMK